MIESLPSGTTLQGRYRIERALGSGGFGHVYLAVDTVTQQQYAVKEYLVAGPTGQEQLQHEANVLGQLHHPNLPAFHTAFNERGRYYIVLNYIEGNDLTDIIRVARQRNEVIPISRIMDWILAISDAVIFLHSQRPPVIHRDIKPDNIRITPDGTAILVDLGNAKAADGARTLFFIRHQGTPGYAPEEQYPGGSGTDVRSDVYALGGTLYFALTGHEPPSISTRKQSIQQGQRDLPTLQEYLANNPPEESLESQPAQQFKLGVTKPSKPAPRHSRHIAQLGKLPPQLLDRLNQIIQRAMAMKPRDRYQSVTDMAKDLRQVAQALSASQPRGVDTHSTQPDLAELYEHIQAARHTSISGIIQADTAPIPPSKPEACPRCGASLAAGASYCPRCGAALSPTMQANAPNGAAIAQHPSDATVTGNSASGGAGGNTTSPAASSLAQQPKRTIPTAQTQTSASSDAATKATALPTAYNVGKHNHRQSAQQQAHPSPGQRISASSSGFQPEQRMILFLAIIVVAALVIMVLLLLSATHHSGAHVFLNSL